MSLRNGLILKKRWNVARFSRRMTRYGPACVVLSEMSVSSPGESYIFNIHNNVDKVFQRGEVVEVNDEV